MSPRDDATRLGDVLERISRIESAEVVLVKTESNQDWDVAKTAFDAILYDLPLADLRAACDTELKK